MIKLHGLAALKRPLARAALCGVVLLSLQGCVEMVVGSAVMGTIAAADRRTLGAQTEDKTITVKAETRIPGIVGDSGHVNIASFNRKILLTGEVKDEQTKATVEREVRAIEGVQSIINELEVAPPSRYTDRSNDALITGKVKASFVDEKQLSANSIKVVTERGNVYLMGLVTPREGDRAGQVARGVSGVRSVVKVFDYITDDEMRRSTILK